jgi:hypothetical protein
MSELLLLASCTQEEARQAFRISYHLTRVAATYALRTTRPPMHSTSYNPRQNWVFCWTEVGAIYVGIIQSLIASCKLQGIDPYTYLVDVLIRLGQHSDVNPAELIPQKWKEKFAGSPLRSDLRQFNNVAQ